MKIDYILLLLMKNYYPKDVKFMPLDFTDYLDY